jgi:mannose-6-phosphate isomerase-like protein (cupin superfamily)
MNNKAQVIITCIQLNEELEFFVHLGFKMQQILPADNPQVYVISGFDLILRLVKGENGQNVVLQLPQESDNHQSHLISPSGVKIQYGQAIKIDVDRPDNVAFYLNKFNLEKSWVTGRAGMLYRDLIPSRLNGVIIASNIMIPKGGPVPDHVHYHSIQFQLIFCVKGWVKVVYEDQGEPFVLKAGDCVTQPPEIRHQVLESSDGLEVIEIGLPAEHLTTLDYQMSLPTGKNLPDRVYKDQRFCHHINDHASWEACNNTSMMKCQTTVMADSAGIAAVNVFKAGVLNSNGNSHQGITLQHQDILRFYYVMAGNTKMNKEGNNTDLNRRDSFLLPAGLSIQLSDVSLDFQCVEFVLKI